MYKIKIYCVFFCVSGLFFSSISFSLTEDNQTITLKDDQSISQEFIQGCQTCFVEIEHLLPKPAQKIPIGLLLLLCSYWLGEESMAQEFLVALGVYFLTGSINKEFKQYFESYERNRKQIKKYSEHRQEKNNYHSMNIKQLRIRIGNCLSFSMRIAISSYILMSCEDNLHGMLTQEINPFAFESDAHEFDNTSIYISYIWVLALGSTVHNLSNLITNLLNKNMNEDSLLVFDLSNGLLVGQLVPLLKKALQPSMCENILERVDELVPLYDITINQQLLEDLRFCVQSNSNYVFVFFMVTSYANQCTLSCLIKMYQNIFYLLNRYTENKRIDELEKIVFEQPSFKPIAKRYKKVNFYEQQRRNEVFGRAQSPFRIEDSPFNNSKCVVFQPVFETGGNFHKPPKPKRRQKAHNPILVTKEPFDEKHSYGLKRLETIQEIFIVARQTEVSKEQILALMTKVTALLNKGKSFIQKRACIEWQGADGKPKKISFEMAHSNSSTSFTGYKLTKALKALLLALIFDISPQELDDIQKALLLENAKECSSWRLARKEFFKHK